MTVGREPCFFELWRLTCYLTPAPMSGAGCATHPEDNMKKLKLNTETLRVLTKPDVQAQFGTAGTCDFAMCFPPTVQTH